jgi:hypothetical protein
MADGDISLNSSGDEIMNASGDTYIKCCCGGTPCANCSGSTPALWTASFTSVDLNTVCEIGCYSPEFNKADTATFSGDFSVPQTGACVWRYYEPYTTIKIVFASGGTCSPVERETTHIEIEISRGAATTLTQAWLWVDDGGPAGNILIFENEVANASVPCDSPSTNASDLVAYSAIACQLGKNGSVTLSP